MTEFVEVKTQDLSGAALDWAVAMAEGYRVDPEGDGRSVISPKGVFTSISVRGAAEGFGYRPSADWNQGGPLLDRFEIEILRAGRTVHAKRYGMTNAAGDGDTALIAACRAIVASVLGHTVSAPKELLA